MSIVCQKHEMISQSIQTLLVKQFGVNPNQKVCILQNFKHLEPTTQQNLILVQTRLRILIPHHGGGAIGN